MPNPSNYILNNNYIYVLKSFKLFVSLQIFLPIKVQNLPIIEYTGLNWLFLLILSLPMVTEK